MRAFARRRRFLIDKLQVKLLLVNFLYLVTMVMIFVGILFGPLVATMLNASSSLESKIAAADRMLLLHKTVWLPVFILLLLFCCHSVLYTHRIAGPLYRFRRVFRAIGAGDLRVRAGVRTKDYLGNESDAINEMIDGLLRRVREVQRCFVPMREALRDVVHAPTSGDAGELATSIERLASRIEKAAESLEGFGLPEGGSPTGGGEDAPQPKDEEEARVGAPGPDVGWPSSQTKEG